MSQWDGEDEEEEGGEGGQEGSHEGDFFGIKFGTDYPVGTERQDDYGIFALMHNSGLTNSELLDALSVTVARLKSDARDTGQMSPPDMCVLRLYEALERTEHAFHEKGEDYEEIETRFYEAVRGAEVPGQYQAMNFMRSILEKIAKHKCQCNACMLNRTNAVHSLKVLDAIDRATGQPSSGDGDTFYQREDGTNINTTENRVFGSMFIPKFS